MTQDKQKLAFQMTGMARDEVIEKVAKGLLPENCQAILWWEITPQEIAFKRPMPRIMWGIPPDISEEKVEELFLTFDE
jgi:hypothetical protein